jgi:hypothetical protein
MDRKQRARLEADHRMEMGGEHWRYRRLAFPPEECGETPEIVALRELMLKAVFLDEWERHEAQFPLEWFKRRLDVGCESVQLMAWLMRSG